MKQLTMRQTGMMISLSMISIKFLVYPAVMARFAGRDGYIATAMGFALDLFFIGLILFVLKKFPDKTLKDLMTEAYGEIVSRLVFAALFFYMCVKTLFIMKEAHTYFLDTLFNKFSLFMFILPMVVISVYIANRQLKTLGRSVEMVFFLIFICVIIAVIMPLEKIDIYTILPVMENGLEPVLEGLAKTGFSFGDQLVLMLLLGKIRFGKDKTSKVFLYALVTAIFVIILDIIFISLFDSISVNERLAVTDIPLHSTNPMTIGRLDWLTIILWIVTLSIQSGIFLYLAIDSFSTFTSIPRQWSVPIVGLLIIILLSIFALGLAKLIEIIISPTFYLIIIAIQVILSLMVFGAGLILLRKKKTKKVKQNEKIKENI